MFKRAGGLAKLTSLQLVAVLATGGVAAGTPSVPTGNPVEEARAQYSSQGRVQTIDDVFASVSRRLPEFGGMYLDAANNTQYVYLTASGPAMAAAATADLQAALGRDFLAQGRTTIVLQAQYTFVQLKEWRDRMNADVLRTPGVVFTDIDDTKNRLAVGVATAEARSTVEEHLARLGIPREAVNIEDVGSFLPNVSLQDNHRPLVGGLQIQNEFGPICTLGFNTTRQGVAGFVTNSHCTAASSANFYDGVNATIFYQSTIGDVNRIGVETVDPVPFTGGSCPAGSRCRLSDSAFVQLDPGIAATQGLVARPGLLDPPPAWNGVDTFRVPTEANPVVGMAVTKVGRTTGRTSGNVTRVGADVNAEGQLVLLGQVIATYATAPGDSGSPVLVTPMESPVNPINTTLVGITWGFDPTTGTSVFSTIGSVRTEFNIASFGGGRKNPQPLAPALPRPGAD
jgi:hypothetical protein